jgi:hypothetical protein
MSTNVDNEVFPELEQMRGAALRALGDVRPVSLAEESAFHGQRTGAGQGLPPSYLVHFLLIDLLDFPSLGHFEKVAWTVPVQFRGRVLVIEHRKLGLGVFVQDAAADEELARELVARIHRAVKAARPFFDWLASRAVARSRVNVVNNASQLFARFEFLRRSYRAKRDEAIARRDEKVITEQQGPLGHVASVFLPRFELENESRWLALAAVDAFFSWTEHVFVHLAILTEKATTGHEVTELAEADWPDKFKAVLDITDATTKKLFDDLLEIRRELRNFMAHGAFGKDGQAFHFHSSAGAVPVVLPHQTGSRRFIIAAATHFDDEATLAIIEKFVEHLWAGDRSPARIYIQESGMPLILTMASDGRYAAAMCSDEDMQSLVDELSYRSDQAANMDWGTHLRSKRRMPARRSSSLTTSRARSWRKVLKPRLMLRSQIPSPGASGTRCFDGGRELIHSRRSSTASPCTPSASTSTDRATGSTSPRSAPPRAAEVMAVGTRPCRLSMRL